MKPVAPVTKYCMRNLLVENRGHRDRRPLLVTRSRTTPRNYPVRFEVENGLRPTAGPA